MSQPYIGEVRAVGFTFPPVGWATCNGAIQSIAENSTLFNLIGTTYGGDGVQTFGLPNLQSRVPMHQGSSYVIGSFAGTENVTLQVTQIPAHNHALNASNGAATTQAPS